LFILIDTIKYKPDIICIQETHASKDKIPEITGYTYVHIFRINQKGGGCAIYIINKLKYENLNIDIPIATGIEVLGIKFKCQDSLKIYNIVNIYIPLSTKIDADVLNNILNKKDTFFVGDFNAKNTLWGSPIIDFRGRILEELIERNNLVCLNTGESTRLNFNGKTSHLDLSFCSSNLAISSNWSVLENSCGSDHYPCQIVFSRSIASCATNPSKTLNTPINHFNYRKADWSSFRKEYKDNLLSDVSNNIVSEDYNRFVSSLLSAAKKTIPISLNPVNFKYKSCPFWNKDCSLAIKNRLIAEKKMRKTKKIEDIIDFKKCKAKAQFCIKKAKHNYWDQFCGKLDTDSKIGQVWTVLKKIKGNNNNNKQYNIKIPGKELPDNKNIADEFMEKFKYISSDSNLEVEFHQKKSQVVNKYLEEIRLNSFLPVVDNLNAPIEMKELLNVLEVVNINSAPGPDGISNHLLKNLPIEGNVQLLNILSKCWNEASTPAIMKEAFVTPVLKQGKDKYSSSSYRPITLSNNIVKLLEKILANRLKFYIESNRLYNTNQAGFRKNHCTLDHIIRLKTEAETAVKSGNITVGVFLDFTSAFDLLWRDGLFLKLLKLGIKGKFLAWLKDFLENRALRVKVDDALSEIYFLDNGVPQGCSISPILFNIMINDFPKLSEYTSAGIFADDSSIWRSGKNIQIIKHHLQGDLDIISNWARTWGFQINTAKSFGIVFTNKISNISINLTINNVHIEIKKEYKFLGVIFDSRLTWKPHILYVCDRAKKCLNLMRAICGTVWGASKKILLLLYRSLIRSIIDYGCLAYEGASKSNLKYLDSIQYQALLIATGGFIGTPLFTLLAECAEKSLEYRRIELRLKYLTKLNYIPVNPAKGILVDSKMFNLGIIKKAYHQDFDQSKLNIPYDHLVYNSLLYNSFERVEIDFKLLNATNPSKKEEYLSNFAITSYLENNYPKHTYICVDGSKTKYNRVGFGVFIPK
jgi:Reverse transcriptase (RNA-dependent DNA polymerase)/Endonuclease-reverse transcriptase